MSKGPLIQGAGLALISIFGLIGNILHFIKFSKLTKRDIYDKILLQCTVFNVIALVFGFFLVSLGLLLEYFGIHSNTHTGLSQVNIFGAYVGLGGSSFSVIFLLLERLLKSSYPKHHARLNIIWISILISVTVGILAKFYLLEFEVMCVGGGVEAPHENILGVCPEGKKAFLSYSTLRSTPGYRAFVIFEMLVTAELFPLTAIPAMNWFIYRQQKWTDVTTLRTSVASAVLACVDLVQLVPICYEVHALTQDMSTWEFHYDMPAAVFIWYQVSHFFSMMLPAVYPWIFNGPSLLTSWFKQDELQLTDREMLITVNELDEEANICSNQVSEEEANTNPAYLETN